MALQNPERKGRSATRLFFFEALYFYPRGDVRPHGLKLRSSVAAGTLLAIWVRHFSQPKPLSARWTVSVGRSLKLKGTPLR